MDLNLKDSVNDRQIEIFFDDLTKGLTNTVNVRDVATLKVYKV